MILFARVNDLIEKSRGRVALTRTVLEEVIASNDKKRFSLDSTGQLIRANQGHSLQVDLQLQPVTPPAKLYHGTVEKFLETIRVNGLQKMERHHVHLSLNQETAVSVGSRRGKPIILTIDSERMAAEGFQFFVSANGVWLTDHVSPEFIIFP